MTHDEAIERLFLEYEAVDKKRYTDLFLSSLTDSKWNSGLYVYAAMKTFPKHNFTEREGDVDPKIYATWTDEQKSFQHSRQPCIICSAMRHDIDSGEWRGISRDVWNDRFYFIAGLSTDDIYRRLYVLQRINRLESTSNITEQDFDMFKEILLCLKNAEPGAKIRDINKQLKESSFFKPLATRMKDDGLKTDGISINQTCSFKVQCILQTLGVCGILRTEKHKAPFYEYRNLAVAPRTSRSSDWSYPVDFWKGSDGIDWEAFGYWFGEYEEVKDIRKP